MAWNEPGNGKNPWDKGGGNDGPPDLDKIVRDWQRRFNALFGGKGGRTGNEGSRDQTLSAATRASAVGSPDVRKATLIDRTTQSLLPSSPGGVRPTSG